MRKVQVACSKDHSSENEAFTVSQEWGKN